MPDFSNMCGSRKLCQRGSNSDSLFVVVFLLVDEGRDYANTTKSGPLLARQGNTILMVFH